MANPDTDWIEPDPADVDKVMSQLVLNAADQQSNKSDPDKSRATEILRMVVARIRSAVKLGGQSPLSATAGTVPPEAEQFALVLTADSMTASTPNLGQVVVTMQGGTGGPWKDLVTEAKKWLAAVAGGALVTRPTDPQQTGDGTELVPVGQAYQAGTYTLTGLVVGTLYAYLPGPNDAQIACGATILTGAGSFYALATTATITAGTTPGIVFVTASVQKAVTAVNTTSGGAIVGEVDMSTD